MQTLRDGKQEESLRAAERIWSVNYRFAMLSGQLELAAKMAEEIDSRWLEMSEVLEDGRLFSYYYNFMIVFWFLGDPPTANLRLARMLNYGHAELGSEQMFAARTIRLLIYYDMQWQDLDVKTLKKHGNWQEFHQLFHGNMNDLIRMHSFRKIELQLQLFLEELEALAKEQSLPGAMKKASLTFPSIYGS